MIRFNCPNCNRPYELAVALARLALVCKGCGNPLVIPDSAVDEPDTPMLPPLPLPLPNPLSPSDSQPPASETTPVAGGDWTFRLTEPDDSPDIDFNIPGPTASHRESDLLHAEDTLAATTRPARQSDTQAMPPETRRPVPPFRPQPSRGRLLAVAADVLVGLALLLVGVLLGELLCRKSTRQVWSDAGGAVEFPPVELLMWFAPLVLLALVYGLLLSRGLSVGNWLKKRLA